MRVAILTNFHEVNPNYSLTSIVSDQMNMLHEYGHDVHLFVSEKMKDRTNVPDYVTLHNTVMHTPLTDYKSIREVSNEHKKFSVDYADRLGKELADFDIAFTHDWIFTGWNLPFALVIRALTKRFPNFHWLHWIHSIPTGRKDWWKFCEWYNPKTQRIVFPNGTDASYVAIQYRCHLTNISVIPHIKDLRTWFDFSEETKDIIRQFPSLMTAQYVQVYPVGSDRLQAKRLDAIIQIFGRLKAMGNSVCLLVANSWAVKAKLGRAGETKTHDFSSHRALAENVGLTDKEFIFTSEIDIDKYGLGISKRMVRELLLCSNLFIYPTREESFGLIGPEASLSGAKIMVLNKDLAMMYEVNTNTGLFESFGSFLRPHPATNPKKYEEIATRIVDQYEQDLAVKSATNFRRRLNYNTIYTYHYKPLLDNIQTLKAIGKVL